ncbi:MAG: C10 family peptidase, partial [Bacteroidales bacterium]|nr:C10 family peptidase [Candidatus Colimorpha onthohippi]
EYPIYQGGNKCIEGSGATAAAKIIAYWRYQKCSVDTIMSPNLFGMGYVSPLRLGQMVYRYDLMPLAVSGGSKDQKKTILDANSSDSSVYATSMFCYHVSVALQSSMTSSSTGTNHVTTLSGLRDVFKYDANDIRYVGRGSTPADKWDSTIRNEIWGRRPVFYRASSVAGEGRDASGHAFVICGHRPTQNKFYVNWGWGYNEGKSKTSDGWYDLSLTDTAGGYVFSEGHGAIIGIHPPLDSLEALGFTEEMLRIQDVDGVSDATIGTIHPNPASHFVNIPCSFSSADNAVLEVYNVQGRLMECRQVSGANELISINVQNYPKGVYTCRLRGASSRFVVQ